MSKLIRKTLACPCCKRITVKEALLTDAELLAEVVDGATITSGDRCKNHNEALKKRGLPASDTSRHLKGDALDIVPNKMPVREFHSMVLSMLKNGRFKFVKGVGLYDWGVHIDNAARNFDYRVKTK